MSNSVTTTFAGETGPEEQEPENRGIGVILAIAFFLASPITSIAGIATWFAFSYGHIRRSVIFLALVPYLLILAFFIMPSIQLFMESWTVLLPSIVSRETEIVPGILTMILWQTPVALPLGVLLGLAYSTWRWITRPTWQVWNFRLTPWEVIRNKRNIEDIKEDRNGPMNGRTLGVNSVGQKIVQTDNESALHTLVIGPPGSGKTTTLMSALRDSIRRGQGAIIVDLKGGPDFPNVMAKYAKRYNRNFMHWTMQSLTEEYTGPAEGGPAYYDPIARGEATRRKDLLIASRTWSEEHYKIQASSYMQLLFNVAIGNPAKDTSTLADVVHLLNPKTLQERAIPLGSNAAYQNVVRAIDEMNDGKISPTMKSAIEGMQAQLGVLLHSVAGPWLQVDYSERRHNIDLKKTAHNGDVVVFSLDSANYQELSSVVANLITQDLKTLMSELMRDPAPKPVHIVFDEFSSIGSDNLVGLVNKAREPGMPVTLSTQALGDLKKIDPTFMDQILGIVSSFVLLRANSEEDAEIYAGLTGKTLKTKFRQSVEHDTGLFGLGKGSGTGSGTIEEVEEYRVLASEIQELKMGEIIFIAKSPFRLERVLVIPEDMATAKQSLPPVQSWRKKAEIKEKVDALIVDSFDDHELNQTPILTTSGFSAGASDPEKRAKLLGSEATKLLGENKPGYTKSYMPKPLPQRPIELKAERTLEKVQPTEKKALPAPAPAAPSVASNTPRVALPKIPVVSPQGAAQAPVTPKVTPKLTPPAFPVRPALASPPPVKPVTQKVEKEKDEFEF